MGILNWLGIGKEIAEPINAIGELYTTDKERLDGEAKIQQEITQRHASQNEINKVYATSTNFFNSSWIPLIGWTSGFLLLLFFAPQIAITTYVWGKNCIMTGKITPYPMSPDDIKSLVYLVFGMGGLGIVRNKII